MANNKKYCSLYEQEGFNIRIHESTVSFLKIGEKIMVIGEKIVAEDTDLTYINLTMLLVIRNGNFYV